MSFNRSFLFSFISSNSCCIKSKTKLLVAVKNVYLFIYCFTVSALCTPLQWQTIQVRWPNPANELPTLSVLWPCLVLSLWRPSWWPTRWALSRWRRSLWPLHAQHHRCPLSSQLTVHKLSLCFFIINKIKIFRRYNHRPGALTSK